MTDDPFAPAPEPGKPSGPTGPTGPGGLPGPTGYVAPAGSTQVLPPAASGRPRRLVVGLVAAGVAVTLGVGAAGAVAVRRLVVGSPDRLVATVPADAVAYAHVNLQPSASNLLGLSSLAERLEAATGEDLLDADRLTEEVGEDEPGFAEDVQPWLGRQAGAFALALPQDDGTGADGAEPEAGATDAAALVLVSDRDAAEAFVVEHMDPVGDWDAGDGATGWRLGTDDAVLALTDDMLVVGTETAVAAAMDPAEETLGDRAGYTDLVDALPASVATAWVDVAAVSSRVDELSAGAYGGLAGQVPVAQVAMGLSLSSGAADLTTVSRPTDGGEAPGEAVAAADLADLPAGGLVYLRYPDAGAYLGTGLDALDAAAEGTDGPLPSAEVDEALGAYGTDVATVTGWLGDVVATVSYDPTQAEDNAGLLLRAAVSDEAAAADLVDTLAADVPPDSGLEMAPGSLGAGSAGLLVDEGSVTLRAGELPEGTLAQDDAFAAATDGLAGDPVAYLDVRALVGALAPLAGEAAEEDREALDALAGFDRLVVTTEHGDDGLDRSSVRLSWGEELRPLDLQAPVNPPDVDLGALGELEDLTGLGGAEEPPALGTGDPGALDPGALDPGAAGSAYGDDPALDALWDGCAAGDAAACGELYLSSPLGSEYEAFALTCGGRAPENTFDCEALD